MSQTREVAASATPSAPRRGWLAFAGPGLLVAVGYMDPGNWATDIAAGSHYGYALLGVVVISSLAAIVLQLLAMKLGLVTRADLAQLARRRWRPWVVYANWALAELAVIACDVAEVLGCALAFKLAFHLPLALGVLLTGLDTLLVLALQGRGFRWIEAIVLGLVATIAASFAIELALLHPAAAAIFAGAAQAPRVLAEPDGLYLAIAVLGATVMPHNLYLHSALVAQRGRGGGSEGAAVDGRIEVRRALRLGGADVVASLFVAMLINAAILIVAGAAFHGLRGAPVDIEGAYRLLTPVTGAAFAAGLFAVALFASGQSSTLTGTLAGQVILEGFLGLRIAPWKRRLITRGLAILPAFAGVLWLGEGSVGELLVLSQVVLAAQLPFAIYALMRFTDDRTLMGAHANRRTTQIAGWTLMIAITAANAWLTLTLVAHRDFDASARDSLAHPSPARYQHAPRAGLDPR